MPRTKSDSFMSKPLKKEFASTKKMARHPSLHDICFVAEIERQRLLPDNSDSPSTPGLSSQVPSPVSSIESPVFGSTSATPLSSPIMQLTGTNSTKGISPLPVLCESNQLNNTIKICPPDKLGETKILHANKPFVQRNCVSIPPQSSQTLRLPYPIMSKALSLPILKKFNLGNDKPMKIYNLVPANVQPKQCELRYILVPVQKNDRATSTPAKVHALPVKSASPIPEGETKSKELRKFTIKNGKIINQAKCSTPSLICDESSIDSQLSNDACEVFNSVRPMLSTPTNLPLNFEHQIKNQCLSQTNSNHLELESCANRVSSYESSSSACSSLPNSANSILIPSRIRKNIHVSVRKESDDSNFVKRDQIVQTDSTFIETFKNECKKRPFMVLNCQSPSFKRFVPSPDEHSNSSQEVEKIFFNKPQIIKPAPITLKETKKNNFSQFVRIIPTNENGHKTVITKVNSPKPRVIVPTAFFNVQKSV